MDNDWLGISGLHAVPGSGQMEQTAAKENAPLEYSAGQPTMHGLVGVHAPTPSGVLRVRQRVETEQSVLSELNVFNEQLIALPDRLQERGIARDQSTAYYDVIEAYAYLTSSAWHGFAEDRLDKIASEPDYRQMAVAVSRRISHLQQEAATPWPDESPPERLPRPGLLWRTRVGFVRAALVRWRVGLRAGNSADIMALGTAHNSMNAAAGIIGMSDASLLLQRMLMVACLSIAGLLTAVLMVAATTGLILGQQSMVLVPVAGAALVWWLAEWMLAVGPAQLWRFAGAARWRLESHFATVGVLFLAVWRWFWSLLTLGSFGLLITVAVMSRSGRLFLSAHNMSERIAVLAGPIMPTVLALLGVTLLAPLWVHLPAMIIEQLGLVRQMVSNPLRLPAARLVDAGSALRSLIWLTAIVLGLALSFLQSQGGWPGTATHPGQLITLFNIGQLSITPLAPVTALIIIVLYLGAVEIPHRIGVERWRQHRLRLLAEQKHTVTQRLERLATTPNAAGDIPAVQYDVARLQFLQLQERDILKTRGGPFRPSVVFAALVIVLAVAFGLDIALTLLPMPFPR